MQWAYMKAFKGNTVIPILKMQTLRLDKMK